MQRKRTNRRFNQAPDLEVSKQVGKNIAGFTGNLALPEPPVAPAELTVKKGAFDQWIVKAANGGKFETEQKDAARVDILKAVNKDASYVDMLCDDDEGIILSAGFEPVSGNRAQVVLEAPIIVAAAYGQAGEIKLRVKGDRNRKAIQGRIKAVGGEYGPVITFQNSRKIIFEALLAGTSYVMELCGLGGSTGMSDWSEPVTKVAV